MTDVDGIVSRNAKIDADEIKMDCSSIDDVIVLDLIESALEKFPTKSASDIAKYVFMHDGIYINEQHCSNLLKNFRYLSKKNYAFVSVATTIISFIFLFLSGINLTNILILVLTSPLVFGIFYELSVYMAAFRFDPATLGPRKINLATSENVPSVSIIIPSCNEPFVTNKMTFDSALSLEYPASKKQIIVVDNSDLKFSELQDWKDYVESFRPTGKNAVSDLEVIFIHRDGREGFKPRNLDIALAKVTKDLTLFLDVDSTLQSDTLLRIVNQFKYIKKLGFIQLYTLPTNCIGNSKLAFSQGILGYLHRLYLVFSSHRSTTLFYGHNGIWRTSLLREIGDILEYHNNEVLVAEDLSMTLRAKQKGYRGKGVWVESGEWVPTSLRQTDAMWLRWTVGTLQVFSKHFSSREKLKSYSFFEIVGWTHHFLSYFVYGLVPLCVFLGLVLQSKFFLYLALLSLATPFFHLFFCANKFSLNGMSYMKKLLNAYCSCVCLQTYISWVRFVGICRYFSGYKQGWVPTGKSQEGKISWGDVIDYHKWKLLFSVAASSYALFLIVNANSGWGFNLGLCGAAYWCLNLLFSVLIFGTSRQHFDSQNIVAFSKIDNYLEFYRVAQK